MSIIFDDLINSKYSKIPDVDQYIEHFAHQYTKAFPWKTLSQGMRRILTYCVTTQQKTGVINLCNKEIARALHLSREYVGKVMSEFRGFGGLVGELTSAGYRYIFRWLKKYHPKENPRETPCETSVQTLNGVNSVLPHTPIIQDKANTKSQFSSDNELTEKFDYSKNRQIQSEEQEYRKTGGKTFAKRIWTMVEKLKLPRLSKKHPKARLFDALEKAFTEKQLPFYARSDERSWLLSNEQMWKKYLEGLYDQIKDEKHQELFYEYLNSKKLHRLSSMADYYLKTTNFVLYNEVKHDCIYPFFRLKDNAN